MEMDSSNLANILPPCAGLDGEFLLQNHSWAMRCANYSSRLDTLEVDRTLEQIISVVVSICFGIIGLGGLLGNVLVVLVVSTNPPMRSTTNLLIINLAIADLLFVIFCVPFTATDYILPTWPFGDLWCKVVQYMIVVTCHASVYTLVLMSVDRFLAVVHPIASMSIRTERNAFYAILLIWLLVTTTGIPAALCHGVREYPFQGGSYSACIFETEKGYDKFSFHLAFFLSSCVVPLTLISVLYMGMVARLWRGAPGFKTSSESRRGKRRVTRLVVVVVLVFAICWCPIQTILVLKSMKRYETTHINIIIQIVAHVLAYTNSCINPVLYAFLSDNFRKAFQKAVWCGPLPVVIPPVGGQPTKTTRTTGNGTSHLDVL